MIIDTDPAFYKKFSELLKETISAYEQGRIDEAEYLKKVINHRDSVLSHTDDEIPSSLSRNNAGKAYFGLSLEVYKTFHNETNIFDTKRLALDTALAFDTIIQRFIKENEKVIVDWQSKINLIGKMKIEMEDFLIDEIKRTWEIPMTFEDMDSIIDRCVDVAKLWFK